MADDNGYGNEVDRDTLLIDDLDLDSDERSEDTRSTTSARAKSELSSTKARKKRRRRRKPQMPTLTIDPCSPAGSRVADSPSPARTTVSFTLTSRSTESATVSFSSSSSSSDTEVLYSDDESAGSAEDKLADLHPVTPVRTGLEVNGRRGSGNENAGSRLSFAYLSTSLRKAMTFRRSPSAARVFSGRPAERLLSVTSKIYGERRKLEKTEKPPDAYKMGFLLNFADADEERAYQKLLLGATAAETQKALLLLIVFELVVGATDAIKIPVLGAKTVGILFALRYALVLPTLIATFFVGACWPPFNRRRHINMVLVTTFIQAVFMTQLGVAIAQVDDTFDGYAVRYLTHAFVFLLFQSNVLALPIPILIAGWGCLLPGYGLLILALPDMYVGILSLAFLMTALMLVLGLGAYIQARNARGRWKTRKLTEAEHRRARVERNLGKQLLANILPETVIQRFTQESAPTATMISEYDESTVLVCDIVGFTALSSLLSPQDLVRLLAELFSKFDRITGRLGLEKIKTVGDAYIAAGGVPTWTPYHCELVGALALEMHEAMAAVNLQTGNKYRLNMRIGIHTGAVFGGILGSYRYCFDLYGPTVQRAAELEATGKAGAIHVSEEAAIRLWPSYHITPSGTHPCEPSALEIEPCEAEEESKRTWYLHRKLDEEEKVDRLEEMASAPFVKYREQAAAESDDDSDDAATLDGVPLPITRVRQIAKRFSLSKDDAHLAWLMRVHLKVEDRTWRMKRYVQCFVGEDAVHFISETLSIPRESALKVGDRLLASGCFYHVCFDQKHEMSLKDSFLFYRFADTAEEGLHHARIQSAPFYNGNGAFADRIRTRAQSGLKRSDSGTASSQFLELPGEEKSKIRVRARSMGGPSLGSPRGPRSPLPESLVRDEVVPSNSDDSGRFKLSLPPGLIDDEESPNGSPPRSRRGSLATPSPTRSRRESLDASAARRNMGSRRISFDTDEFTSKKESVESRSTSTLGSKQDGYDSGGSITPRSPRGTFGKRAGSNIIDLKAFDFADLERAKTINATNGAAALAHDVWNWVSSEIGNLAATKMNTFSLQYSLPELEWEFKMQWHREKVRPLQRGVIGFIVLAVAGDFIFAEQLGRPDLPRWIELGVFAFVWLLVLLLSFIDSLFQKFDQIILTCASVLTAIALISLGITTSYLLLYAVCAVYLFSTFLLQLHFFYAFVSNSIVQVAVCVAVWFATPNVIDALQLLVFLVAVLAAASFTHYEGERFYRRAFLDRQILQREMHRLEIEREKSRQLMSLILPQPVAKELEVSNGELIAHSYPHATVMFATFVDATASELTLEVFNNLNALLLEVDALIQKRGLEKIKCLGATYMVAAGLKKSGDGTEEFRLMADLALEMATLAVAYSVRTQSQWLFRAGVNMGPVVAGVIGSMKFAYDLWGDAVNVASRMESTCEFGRIQVTDQSGRHLGTDYTILPRGSFRVKGKGVLSTLYISGKKTKLNDKDTTHNEFGLDPDDMLLLQGMRHPARGVRVGTHTHNLREYEDCFSSMDMVDWLVARVPRSTRSDAIATGNRLRECGAVCSAGNKEKVVKDKLSQFYRFHDSPAAGGKFSWWPSGSF